MKPVPPRIFTKFFRWYCRPRIVDYIEGDLVEVYYKRVQKSGKARADIRYIVDVIMLLRPGIIRPLGGYQTLNNYGMFKTYFKIGLRNLLKNKGYSLINVGGLTLGMVVAMLIGLWVYDELTFNSYHPTYNRVAQVMIHNTSNKEIRTGTSHPEVLATELRTLYGDDFKYVVHSIWTDPHTLTYGDKILTQTGNFFDPEITELLDLKMIDGAKDGLKNMNSILISESVANAYFENGEAVGKSMRIDDRMDVLVAGVYEDIPDNSTFKDLKLLMPWELYLSQNKWIREMSDPWSSNFTQVWVRLADHADMEQVSAKIKDVLLNRVSEAGRRYQPTMFLHPMSKWHLYSRFENGVNTGGRIDNVWLFATTGTFVLLLACINFMNLSTARSEKRSREVGIRKSIGSLRSQLILQFFTESVMVAFFAFLLSIVVVALMLPTFNEIADKNITLPWSKPVFWLIAVGFSIVTGLLAGLYPALFLSSFQPIKVLKGTFKAGRYSSLPRKALVVVQFTISITLIIGTMVVYQQVKYGQSRAVGYSRDGLMSVDLNWDRIKHFEAMRNELITNGTILEMAQSGSPPTEVWSANSAFNWEGKDPNQTVSFPNNAVSHEYGKTVGWEIKEGRDFSRDFASDSAAFIMNESAAKFIGLKDPIGKTMTWKRKPYTIVGIVKDLLVESPYTKVRPSLFHVSTNNINVGLIRLNPQVNMQDAVANVEAIFRKYNPSSPFQATFVDEEFNRKFGNEQRIGTLASFFAMLAIIISCLGLFGLASFVAEQRTKEMGIRKVLGASVASLWQMLSRDFVILVMVSCIISVPLGYYYLNSWLQSYEYHTTIPWWVFASTCAGALIITIITVSFRAIKAALMNPVKSLRSE
jgi:putative ABC transport system permease protein